MVVLMVAGAAGGMEGMSKIDPLFSEIGPVFKLDSSGLITVLLLVASANP